VGTVLLSQRKRKASGWDVHAPGYEQYSAMQAKQTGAHHLKFEDEVCPLMVKIFFRAVQPSWRESHADSANPSRSRSSAADACAYVWHGNGSEP